MKEAVIPDLNLKGRMGGRSYLWHFTTLNGSRQNKWSGDQFMSERFIHIPAVRIIIVVLLGLVMVIAGFLLSYLGIEAVIQGYFEAMYIIAAGLVLLIVIALMLYRTLQRDQPVTGGPVLLPPPSAPEGFEKDNL